VEHGMMLGIIKNSVGFFVVSHKFRYSLVEALWPFAGYDEFSNDEHQV
jgi:hypothetical protein